MNQIVTLIGYRATGKSTIAPALAQRLDWQCVDSDIEVEKQSGRTIAQIFEEDGEAEFRRLERATIVELLKRKQTVLSVGGGAILDAATRNDLKAAGPVIWLQASVETIASRLTADSKTKTSRPNLTESVDQRTEVTEVLKLRTRLYAETATIVIDTEELDCERVTDIAYKEIAKLLTKGVTE
ncbi:MAG: shikimate kinase [Planctomycetaceae bacterium]